MAASLPRCHDSLGVAMLGQAGLVHKSFGLCGQPCVEWPFLSRFDLKRGRQEILPNMGGIQKLGPPAIGSPYHKDESILGSLLFVRSPI